MFTNRISSSTRGHIDRLDAGLRSIKGAQEIVGLISSRHSVTKLVLGHNELGDDGCVLLFKFLRSPPGRKYRISEISLNSNGIGNRGLLAVASYLKDNTVLKELFLQNNEFTADPETIHEFVQSLNSSQVELLSLTLNRQLSDDFLSLFLPTLDAPNLTSLHLSALNLSPRSLPYITDYLGDTERCRLRTLKCNGNVLGFRAVRSIINTVSKCNYRILALEVHSNHLADHTPGVHGGGPAGGGGGGLQTGTTSDGTDDDDDNADDRQMDPNAWKKLDSELYRVLTRNSTLKKETEQQALKLLKYARIFLLQSSSTTTSAGVPSVSNNTSPQAQAQPTAPAPTSITPQAQAPPRTFPFLSLPIEIQLHILSFQTPILSPSQRNRVYHYASSLLTLPPLLPRLSTLHGPGGAGASGSSSGSGGYGGQGGLGWKSPKGVGYNTTYSGYTQPHLSSYHHYTHPHHSPYSHSYGYGYPHCIPDPSSNLDFASSNGTGGGLWKLTPGIGSSCSSGIGGKCMGPSGSLVCHKEKERKRFLNVVGCDVYDPMLGGIGIGIGIGIGGC